MCYAKPGPRCAAHLEKIITKLEENIASNTADSVSKMSDQAKLAMAKHEFYGTRKGQVILGNLIKKSDSESQKLLSEYKEATRKDYDTKLALYKKETANRKSNAETVAKAKAMLAKKEKELEKQLSLLRKEMTEVDSASENDLRSIIRKETPAEEPSTVSYYSYTGKFGKY